MFSAVTPVYATMYFIIPVQENNFSATRACHVAKQPVGHQRYGCVNTGWGHRTNTAQLYRQHPRCWCAALVTRTTGTQRCPWQYRTNGDDVHGVTMVTGLSTRSCWGMRSAACGNTAVCSNIAISMRNFFSPKLTVVC